MPSCKRICQWLYKNLCNADDPSPKNQILQPLTPEFRKGDHGSYVERINNALNNEQIRNIALSGNYGVGKSSILQEVVNQHKKHTVEISLSTLAPMNGSEHDGSTPEDKNVHTPKQETTTNRIQQEIVKQLLYSIKPHKAPYSRFQRIERFNLWREIGGALLIGVFTVIGFALTEWTDKLAKIVQPITELNLWVHLAVFVLGTLLAFSARLLVHGRIHISKLSAGAATVTLDARSTTYFDQYLDEIVYFFEVSKKKIVVFEDIDRFGDAHIFETLRALNTLLNPRPETEIPIRFIYAIKDSIFDLKVLNSTKTESEEEIKRPEEAEIQRANRTKFFDLIIPVVPFITHRSARDLAIQVLGVTDQEKIGDELINLAARYVPDMRLLKNIYNEFIIFREKIFTDDDKKLNLNESELFAMMLYKSTHLSDFELIRLGKSKLDEIYYLSREFVNENTEIINKEIRTSTLNLTKLSEYGIKKRCLDFGERLISHTERTAKAVGYQFNNKNSIEFNGETFSLENLKHIDFWRFFTSNREVDTLFWYQFNNNNRLSFLRSDLEDVLKDNLDPDDWKEIDSNKLKTDISQKKTKLEFLRSATIKDLINEPHLTLDYNQSSRTFDSITYEILSDGLAYQLITSGYLNRNFTLYTSIFHGKAISANAQNFIIHNVEPNIMDEQLILEESDVKAIINECDNQKLGEQCLYNISILNYLLNNDQAKADIMVQSLAKLGDDESRFLQAYLNNENEHIELIKKLTPQTERTLNFLINKIEMDDEQQLTLVNTALEHLNSELNYNLDDEVSEYLQAHYAELPALINTINKDQAENIAKLYDNTIIRVPKLQPLSEQIRNAFIAKDLYDINVDNLKIAIGNDTNLALDVALEKNKRIYDYLLHNLEKYLSAVIGSSKTVSSNEHFIRVVEDVLASKSPDDLDSLVMHASDDCIIESLDDVNKRAWLYLAKFKRFTSTFNNINSYVSVFGDIDEYLEKVLINSKLITEHKSASEEEKETLAVHILNANKHNLSAEQRVMLVKGLDLTKHYIHATDLPTETGIFFALLLENDLIEDSADTYEHLLETDWPTRESYIEVSNQFLEYVTPALLKGDLADFLASKKIRLDTKVSIVEQAEEFTVDCSKNDLIELAQFAIDQDKKLPIDVIEKMASNQVETKSIILLLSPHLTPSINSEQLFRILEQLKGDYPKLISKGTDRPEIPNTPEDQKLIKTLEALRIISSFKEIADGFIRIFKKHK